MKLTALRISSVLAVAAVGFGIALAHAAPIQGTQPPAAPATPPAASRAPARIAVVDTSRVFSEMQETQEFKAKLETERQKLKAEETERKANIEKLRQQRPLTKPGSADAEKLNDDILNEGIKFEIWGKYASAQAERNQKKLLRNLFEKIEEATQEYAQQEGIDLVLVKQTPELPDIDGINFDQLRGLINQRDVLYASSRIDISSAILAIVDSKFKSGGGVKVPGARSGTGTGTGSGAEAGVSGTTAEKNKPAPATEGEPATPKRK